MAQSPKASGKKLSNIMELIRGNIDFNSKEKSVPTADAFGSTDLMSQETRSNILNKSLQVVDQRNDSRQFSPESLLGLVQPSLGTGGKERIENQKILELMPDVAKGARLMVASIFSPNDLARNAISVVFNGPDISEDQKNKLKKFATDFFQDKLDLKTEAPKWVYQFGYEAGAAIFAIVPLDAFEKIQDDSYASTESFINKVIEPTCHTSLFGFGDGVLSSAAQFDTEVAAVESLANTAFINEDTGKTKAFSSGDVPSKFLNDMTKMFLAQESLNLTDNPVVLRAGDALKTKRANKTRKEISTHFRLPSHAPVIEISAADKGRDKKGDTPTGNPMLLKLPPESVTVIHTPGDPDDHQGYLVLLDKMGSPINAIKQEQDIARGFADRTGDEGNIVAQTYNAYGSGSHFRGTMNSEAMGRIYTQVVSGHIKNRLTKSGLAHSDMDNLDSVFKCMFARFLKQKQTRLLFLPKELVTYMSFDKDQNGYGISRLNKIKFNLGMKMAIQVSKVMATIKAAMDKRKIEVTFPENLLENPEAILRGVMQQYVAKNIIDFSIDPGSVQSQIVDKSISIKGQGIPGLESFDVTNEPDTRSGNLDTDTGMMEYIDKAIINGLGVPAAAMNSLDDAEYARSVTTTNLFFAMEVSIDQDKVVASVSDLLQKYALYSEEFYNELIKIIPQLATQTGKKGNSSTDETSADLDDKDAPPFPEHYTVQSLIETMGISLPKPNVAPSKTQFEALDGMIASITTMVNNQYPDELAGSDDTLKPAIALLRAKLIAVNVRMYLDSSGITGIHLPETSFTAELKELTELNDALSNLSLMMKDKAKLTAPAEGVEPAVGGYQ